MIDKEGQEVMLEFLTGLLDEKRVFADEPMKKHTTFRIGGNARFLVIAETKQELAALISYARQQDVKYFILGNGSNLLVADEGYDGIMIKLRGEFAETKLAGGSADKVIYAGAGAMLSGVAHFALQNGLAGMEFASGIPGTLGGAMVMNAGAYGGEMKQIVRRVEVLTPGGEILVVEAEDMELGYRSSRFKRTGEIVLSAEIHLPEGDKEEIAAKTEEYKRQRTEKQPLEYPSAGSTFKRPEGHFAGKLIMDAGLKGYRVGDAMVSEKHAGFVINAGKASAADVKKLMQDVSDKVYEEFQVRLEPEVIVL